MKQKKVKSKKTFYSELSFILGLTILALGTAFMERADFGVSMVVAPAYILYRKLSLTLPFFTFGMAEYCLQFVVLILLCIIMKKFKKGYLLSFATAVLYGLILDLCMLPLALVPTDSLAVRCVLFVAGAVLCAIGVALLFHTYIAPEAYELMVKELAVKTGADIARVKTIYDLASLALGVVMSFVFFGWLHFEGVKLGTLLNALFNGWLIGQISKFLERKFEFRDRWGLRNFFET